VLHGVKGSKNSKTEILKLAAEGRGKTKERNLESYVSRVAKRNHRPQKPRG